MSKFSLAPSRLYKSFIVYDVFYSPQWMDGVLSGIRFRYASSHHHQYQQWQQNGCQCDHWDLGSPIHHWPSSMSSRLLTATAANARHQVVIGFVLVLACIDYDT